jgi:hypothetical protein
MESDAPIKEQLSVEVPIVLSSNSTDITPAQIFPNVD